MKIQLKTPVVEVTQFKKEMTTGWATRSEMDSMVAGFSRGPMGESSYKTFPFSEHENADELAKAVHRKQDAIPYWEFEGFMITKPKHNSFYWIEDGSLNRGTLADITDLYNILEK